MIIKQALFFVILISGGFFVTQSDFIQRKFGMNKTKSSKSNRGRKIKVLTTGVTEIHNNKVFEAMGTGKAKLSAELYPAVAEEVVKVLFKTQDKVLKGQLLVQLDDRDELLALKLAKVKYNDSLLTLKRFQKVVPQGAVSQNELDTAKTTHDEAKLAIDKAQLEINKRKIIAPFNGIVGIPNVDVGDRVNPTVMITGLDDRKYLYLDFEIPEALAGFLQNNKMHIVKATTPAFPKKVFLAELSAQESRIDPLRRTLQVRAKIDNLQDQLRPGMSFRTKWEIPGKPYPSVPEIALQWSREGAHVWKVVDSKAQKVRVNVISRNSSRVLIEGDIKIDELVVVEGLQRLRDGVDVEVLARNMGNS